MADIIAIDHNIGVMGMQAFLPTSTASNVSTNAGTPPLENVSRV
jgi:hypothetical protein